MALVCDLRRHSSKTTRTLAVATYIPVQAVRQHSRATTDSPGRPPWTLDRHILPGRAAGLACLMSMRSQRVLWVARAWCQQF